MDYQAAATIIDRNSGLYDITTNEGRERRRLFFSTQGYICEFAPRSRRRGYIIPQSTVANWLGVVKVEKPEASHAIAAAEKNRHGHTQSQIHKNQPDNIVD